MTKDRKWERKCIIYIYAKDEAELNKKLQELDIDGYMAWEDVGE